MKCVCYVHVYNMQGMLRRVPQGKLLRLEWIVFKQLKLTERKEVLKLRMMIIIMNNTLSDHFRLMNQSGIIVILNMVTVPGPQEFRLKT